MTIEWRKSPRELIDRFIAETANLPGAESRKMFGYPCCFVNGNMFTGLHQESWIIRLPEVERNEIITTYGTTIFEAMPGRPMKEYVVLPAKIIDDDGLLNRWLVRSLSYAENLPKKVPKMKAAKKA